MESTITSKGQATIPKEVREHLGVKPGDKVKYFILPDGRVYLLPKIPLASLRGMFKGRVKKPVTVEQMRQAVRERASQLDAASRK